MIQQIPLLQKQRLNAKTIDDFRGTGQRILAFIFMTNQNLGHTGSKITPIHRWEDIRMLHAYDIFDFLALLSAFMLAGLMAILSTVMCKIWRDQNDADAAANFKNFLKYAVSDRILSIMSITPVIAAFAMAFVAKPAGAQVGYAYAGGFIFFVGFFIWTTFFNLPVYKAVDAWTLIEAPSDTREQIGRFHRSNAVRLVASLVTAVLFYLAA